MISQDFLERIFGHRPSIGLSIVLVFDQSSSIRQAMTILLSLEDKGIEIDSSDRLAVLAMTKSGSFKDKENRSIRVRLSTLAKLSDFLVIANHLEAIQIGYKHSLSELQSKRQEARLNAADYFASIWIHVSTRMKILDWDLKLESFLIEENNFRLLRFVIKSGNQVIGTYDLDGWSGFLRRNGSWLTDRLASAKRLNQLINEDIDKHLEVATA